jgi:hypothetical protein
LGPRAALDVLEMKEKSLPATGIRFPDLPARCLITIPTTVILFLFRRETTIEEQIKFGKGFLLSSFTAFPSTIA